MKYSMTLAALAAAASIVSAAPVAAPESQIAKRGSEKFTLSQQSTGRKVSKNVPASLAHALGKYNKPVPSQVAAAAAAASGSAVATPSDNDEEYTVPVKIGAQTLQLDFDTGSSDLWVFSTETKGGDNSGHTLYNPTTGKLQSDSSWKISYGDGSGASGNVYADKVAVGAVTATSQAVEVATTVSAGQGQQGGAFAGSDGLLGLASSKINTVSPKPVKTWFDTVRDQLDQPLFTATLKHQSPGSYDFGYLDSSKYSGDISYVDVDFSQGFWQFDVASYGVAGGRGGTFGSAIADTGTTLIVTDNEDFLSDYYGQIDGSSSDQGSYVFPCSSNVPDLTLDIGSGTVTIPGSLINFGAADDSGNTCFGGLQGTGGQSLGFTILGDVFLKAIYAVFDEGNSRFGFAPQA